MIKMCINDGYRYAGAAGTAGPGAIISVSEAEAQALEAGGYAERVDAMPVYTDAPEPEPEPEPEPKREIATSRAARRREKATEK